MPFANTLFFERADESRPKTLQFPCLRYVIRAGWLEAFEMPPEEPELAVPWVQAARGLRKDPVSLAKGSFGVFELFVDEERSVRVADASTRFAHLSSKVQLAQYAVREDPSICPPSGWLRWDCEFDGSAKDPFAHPRPGSEFLAEISPATPWVLKRDGASGGKGIVFVSHADQLRRAVDESRDMEEALPFVDDRRELVAGWAAQRHIAPMLIMGGRKFHLRVYVVHVGARVFRFDGDYEVRVAPLEWTPDFDAIGCHITNGGGAEALHERRFLASHVAELDEVRARVPEFVQRVCARPSSEAMELDATWTPASVLGLDVMVDSDGRLNLLESNHSPASPPYESDAVFDRHVRRLARRIVVLIVTCAVNPNVDAAELSGMLGFTEMVA